MKTLQQGHPFGQALDTAPLIVILASNKNLATPAALFDLREMDSGLAAMAMIVQATEIGLSSCVISISPQEERISSAMTALSMPDYYMPVLMAVFGYPGTDATTSASVENFDRTQVHINGYSGTETPNAVTSASVK
jgi:nitroreductase